MHKTNTIQNQTKWFKK